MHIPVNERDEFYAKRDIQDKRIRAAVSKLKEKYPEAQLSSGYIGNIWWTPKFDDDTIWKVFTGVRGKPDGRGEAFSLSSPFSARVDKLDTLADWAENELEQWIIDVVLPQVEYNEQHESGWHHIHPEHYTKFGRIEKDWSSD